MNTQSIQAQASLLSAQQKFDKVLITGPLQSKYYNDISFKNLEQKVTKHLEKLIKSSFYTHFQVYMGAQNLSGRSYLQEKYKRQQQILKLKIQQTKKNIYKLSKAHDQQQFDNAMKIYMGNMDIIEQRSQQVDHIDFVPVVYIQAKKKRPFYGHLMQQFNRKGVGMLNAKIGYRAPFQLLDTLQFKLQTPLTSLRRKYFNFDLQWTNPNQKYGNIFTKLSHSNVSLFKDIDQKSFSFTLGTERTQKNIRIQLQNKLRNPIIHNKFDQYCLKDYHLPSFKSSLKLTKVWQNSIQFNDISMGKYLETKGQITLPWISKSQFAKFQINYRRFFDTYIAKKYFDNQLMKNLLFNSSLQTNFSWNLMKSFSSQFVSDVNDNLEVRGFDQPKNPIETFSNLKFSTKFNIHNYPLIGQAKIVPFLYAQGGLSLLDLTKMPRRVGQTNQKSQLYGLGSLGLGVAYYVSQFAQIELIYSLGSYQTLPNRQSTNFQIRIGIFD